MSARGLIVRRPTKIELIRLRRRLKLARRLHKMLRDRLTILVQEYLINLKEAMRVREELHKTLMNFYKALALAHTVMSTADFELLYSKIKELELSVGLRNIAGVKALVIEVPSEGVEVSKVSEAIITSYRDHLLKVITHLAEIESALNALGAEVMRTKRRVNALEYILIPKLIATIKYLSMKFEEREREEKSRLKRVKEILTRGRL